MTGLVLAALLATIPVPTPRDTLSASPTVSPAPERFSVRTSGAQEKKPWKRKGSPTIYFKSNSAVLTKAYKDSLTVLAKELSAYPEITLIVSGYADTTGLPGYNLTLSKKRAMAVYNALIRLGVEKKRITVIGCGEVVGPHRASSRVTVTANEGE